jgi:hypothetical protein
MPLLTNVRKYYTGFIFWDWVAIYVTSSFGANGIVTLLFGGSFLTGVVLIAIGIFAWWAHMTSVLEDIQKGNRPT